VRYCLIVLSFCIGLYAQAQLCNGSLGEPVVNIHFGNKNTTAGPLRSGVTNLGYVTGCPIDGNYSIVNAAFGCFGSSWHDIIRDHTGDEEGRFMLINATNAPSVFYVDTITGLCGNTSYEFGAWVANVLKPSSCGGTGTKPNLTFTIETLTGTVLQTYNTGNINEDANLTFKQYGFLFKPDISTTTIVLRIANNAGAGCGNDLALDDITFRPCGPVMSASIDGEVGFNKNICSNNQTIMSLGMTVGPGYINPVYQWQLSTDLGNTWRDIVGATTTSFIRNGTNVGTYQYRLLAGESVFASVPSCRTASSPITIKINNAAPKIGNQLINQCIGGAINLVAASGSGAGLSYNWTGPNGFNANIRNPVLPNIKSGDTGRYIVQVSTTEGCTSNDTISITAFNAINGSFSGNTVICLGDSTVLTAIGGTQFEWYNNTRATISTTGILLAKPSDTTNYQLILRDGLGCADSINIPLYVIKPPLVDAGPNRTIIQGNSVALFGNINGQNNGFVWSPTTNMQQQNTLTPLVSPLNTTTYLLTGYGLNGCAASQDTVQVRVFVSIAPPNSFSPNGDGVHDIWLVPGLETYPNSTLSIFNRDGHILYQAKPYFEGWNGTYKGKNVPTGVYYYIINRGNGEPLLSGSIYLIR
jgi:gliding motility-associated-like protein